MEITIVILQKGETDSVAKRYLWILTNVYIILSWLTVNYPDPLLRLTKLTYFSPRWTILRLSWTFCWKCTRRIGGGFSKYNRLIYNPSLLRHLSASRMPAWVLLVTCRRQISSVSQAHPPSGTLTGLCTETCLTLVRALRKEWRTGTWRQQSQRRDRRLPPLRPLSMTSLWLQYLKSPMLITMNAICYGRNRRLTLKRHRIRTRSIPILGLLRVTRD